MATQRSVVLFRPINIYVHFLPAKSKTPGGSDHVSQDEAERHFLRMDGIHHHGSFSPSQPLWSPP